MEAQGVRPGYDVPLRFGGRWSNSNGSGRNHGAYLWPEAGHPYDHAGHPNDTVRFFAFIAAWRGSSGTSRYTCGADPAVRDLCAIVYTAFCAGRNNRLSCGRRTRRDDLRSGQ
ncbi:MAG: hypothetical protein NVSMB62_04030 [Acidobacteriaceae bacterium]